jgi:predicted DNA-binding transcriptional regulator AlpA
VHHLVGAAEASELLGVSRQRLHVLAQRDDFPKPVAVLAMGNVWEREAVEQWATATGRTRPADDE